MERAVAWLLGWRYALALVGSAVAFLLAITLASAEPRPWRAEVAIVVGSGSGPLHPGRGGATAELADRLKELVRSHQIAANVISTTHLDVTPSELVDRMEVSRPRPGLLRVRVADASRLRAVQIVQEVGFVFPTLLQHRFPRLKATVWDPAHAVGRAGRHWTRDLGLAGAVAALLWGLAGLPALTRPRRPPAQTPQPPPRPIPAAVAPAPAPTPAPRASGSEPQSPSQPARVIQPARVTPEPPAPAPRASGSEPQAHPEPGPAAPEPEPEPVAVAEPGDWNLAELERLVREHAHAYPERAEEWGYYLESMRGFAGPDGRLPTTLDWLVWDTFGDLLGRPPSSG